MSSRGTQDSQVSSSGGEQEVAVKVEPADVPAEYATPPAEDNLLVTFDLQQGGQSNAVEIKVEKGSSEGVQLTQPVVSQERQQSSEPPEIKLEVGISEAEANIAAGAVVVVQEEPLHMEVDTTADVTATNGTIVTEAETEQMEENTERILGDLSEDSDSGEGEGVLHMDISISKEDEALLNDSSDSSTDCEEDGNAAKKKKCVTDNDDDDLADSDADANLFSEDESPEDNTERIEETKMDEESASDSSEDAGNKGGSNSESSSDEDEESVPIVVNSKATFEAALDQLFFQRPAYSRLVRKNCMKNLLVTGDLADTTFVVGHSQVEIKAHKYILRDKSEFFATLFSERWTACEAQPGRIEIPDVEPVDFRSFLEFLYSGETEIREDNGLPILYLARVYGIHDLRIQTVNFFLKNMSVELSVPVFSSLVSFADGTDRDAERLTKVAADFIAKNAVDVFRKSARLDLKLADMARILKMKENEIEHPNELQIFLTCCNLALNECNEKGLEPTGPNCRTIMEPALKYIRLPLVTKADFQFEVCPRKVLSQDEEKALGDYINSNLTCMFAEKLNAVKQYFNVRPRYTTEFKCKRFKEFQTRLKSWTFGRKRNKVDRVSFKVNTNIILRAVGLFGSADRTNEARRCEYNVVISVGYHENPHSHFLTTIADAVDGCDCKNGRLFKVPLNRPVNIISGVMYTVALEVPQGDRTFFGKQGQEKVVIDCQNHKVMFEFSEAKTNKSSHVDNNTGVTIGQIPVMYFSLAQESEEDTEIQIID